MRKYYNLETMDANIRDMLTDFFKKNNYYYELSSVGDGWNFEILLSDNERVNVDAFLDSIFN